MAVEVKFFGGVRLNGDVIAGVVQLFDADVARSLGYDEHFHVICNTNNKEAVISVQQT